MITNDWKVLISQINVSKVQKVKKCLSISVLITVLLLFFDTLPEIFGFLARIQLVPAVFAGSFVVVAVITATTLVFGRIYCSLICPLGLFQDIVSKFTKKQHLRFIRNKKLLRLGILIVFVLVAIFGIFPITAILEPYSAFGRIASELLTPMWVFAWNALAVIPEALEIYLISTPAFRWPNGSATTIVAVVTLIAIGFLSYKWGRTWCNTICPVGAGLGFLAKHSLFKIRIIDHDCINCGACANVCKASCIDANNVIVDKSRCIMCFNCLENCHQGAIVYAAAIGKTAATNSAHMDNEKRAFLGSIFGFSAIPLIAIVAANREKITTLVDVKKKSKYPCELPIYPPGAYDYQRYRERCTLCLLCVSVCPSNILRPSERIAISQPSLSFERGYCWEECIACSNICPTSAIRAITITEKATIKIGQAICNKELCVICETCVQNCPNDAISLINNSGNTEYVEIDAERCIGCGACEYFCPQTAIKVQGYQPHHRTLR